MSTRDLSEQAQDVPLECVPGKATPTKVYGGSALPPGALAVNERTLARYVTPGTVREPHGVPPIGIIGLPEGWVISELYTDDVEEIRVLPFRFPWYSRAYALRSGERLCAVMRNVQPQELGAGVQVVVQFNETGDWSAIFGIIVRTGFLGFRLRRPDGVEQDVSTEAVHFVGKVVAWWDDAAAATASPGISP
jgi:hypothetical protein